MSLNYRTPLEEFALRLDPSEQLQIRDAASRNFMHREVNILSEHFNFFLRPNQKKWLTDRGVELSVYPNTTHSHPACKTLENYLLYVKVPPLLKDLEDLQFLTIKERKLEKLRKTFKGKDIGGAINRLVTSRDCSRYGKRPSPMRLGLEKGQTLFIHDELHYWSHGQIIDFLDIYEPKKVVATFVYPAELLFKYQTSLNPKIYTFEVNDDELIFSPDGVVTESYVQPASAGQLLGMHAVKTKKFSYSIDVEYSIGAHHILVFNREDHDHIIHQRNRFFGPYSCVDASELFNDGGRVALAGIEVDVLQKIILYLFSLKKPDPHSAVAKLRQMMAEEVDLDSMWVVRDLANRISKFSSSWCSNSCLTTLRDWFVDMLPKKVGSYHLRLVDDFDRNLMKLRPLCFHLVTERDRVDWVRVAQVYLESWLQPHDHSARPYGSEALYKNEAFGKDYQGRPLNRKVKIAPERVYEHSVFNWANWYHSGSYRQKLNGEPVHLGPDRFGPPALMGDFREKTLAHAIRVLNALSAEREERERKKRAWNTLVAFCVYGDFDAILEGQTDQGIVSEKRRRLVPTNDSTLEVDVDEPMSDSSHCDVETASSISVESMEELAYTPEKGCTQEPTLSLRPQQVACSPFKRVSKKGRIDLYKIDTQIKFNTKEWQRVGKRNARFFSLDPSLAYFHDRVAYQTYSPTEDLQNLMRGASKAFGVSFNTALVQEYREGGIPMHRDDEDCYDGDDIITINLNGTAKFTVLINGKQEAFHLSHGDVLVMTKDSRDIKHGVTNSSWGRTSITMRRQARQISFHKAFEASASTRCLLNSFAGGLKEQEEVICQAFPELVYKSICENGLTDLDAGLIAKTLGIAINMVDDRGSVVIGDGEPRFAIRHKDHHFFLMEEKEQGSTNTLAGDDQARESNEDFGQLLDKLLGESGGFLSKGDYRADPTRAKALACSLLSGTTGIVCSYLKEGFRIVPGARNDKEARSELDKLGNAVDLPISAITGFAGSGKSYKLQEILRGNPVLRKGTLLVSPRTRLCEDWNQKVSGLPTCTFESALKRDRRKYHTIILDEITLFPPGYLDLMLYTDFKSRSLNKKYIVIGDPLQAAYYCETDNLRLGAKTFYDFFEGDHLEYGFETHRLNMKVARALGVPTKSKVAGDKSLFVCPDFPSAKTHMGGSVDVVLVPSRLCKNRFSGVNCMTYGESQGLTFKRGCVHLNEDSRICSDHHLMVALTRFTEEVCFIFDAKGGLPLFKANSRGLLSRVLNSQNVTTAFYSGMAAPKLKFNSWSKGAGKNSRRERNRKKRSDKREVEELQGDNVDRESRLDGDPWQKSQIFLGSRVHIPEPVVEEPVVQREGNKLHVPLNILRPSRLLMDKIPNKDTREIKSMIGLSQQFREARRESDMDVEDLPQPCTSESIYMSHKNSDDVTFWAAVKKRLRFAEPEKNFKQLKKKEGMGRYMAEEFLRRVKISPVRDHLLLDECRNEFERVKLKKSAELIEHHNVRSDPDARMDEVKIFLKTQLCTKFEKRFCEGKAGQTIACFHHNVLNHFSPYCRYMEKKISEALPDYIYVHQKKNFQELDAYVQSRFRGGICVESDYEAFDASQDATVLAFEVAIMEHMQMDASFIEDYKLMKCTLGSKLGSLAIMRFTGEFCTFLFNTLANMAFTNLRYIWRREVVLFAGDDMCAFYDLPVNFEHNAFFERFTLKAKVNRTGTPMFCGWRLTSFGLFKEPKLILDRLNVAKEKNTLQECLNSYFEEFIFAYNQGFNLELMMDPDQMSAHHTCARKFLRHQYLLSEKNRSRLRDMVPDASEYSSD